MKGPIDIVVFGATGFVGKFVAEYLAEHTPEGVRIGLAGRSREKLERVQAELGPRAADWPVLVADSGDSASLRTLAQSARVIATTAGPYGADGLALVEACIAAGADYADLTGEVLFMRDSIDRYHGAAARKGVRIVHACGFDSIPSDLGVMLLYETARAERAGKLTHTTLVVKKLKGGISGGTVASMKGQLSAVRENPELRKILADPYSLSPDRTREPDLGEQRELRGVRYDAEVGAWVGPFVMASANTRVVRRSNALRGWAYGRRFRYQEVMGFGGGATAPLKAGAMSAGLAAFGAGLDFRPTRSLLERVLPEPGAGPSAETRRTGFFQIDVHGRTSMGARYVARVAAKGDPGYAATAVMLGESALCLAMDRDRSPDLAGVLTPSTAMGAVLVDRLRAAGQTLSVRLGSDA